MVIFENKEETKWYAPPIAAIIHLLILGISNLAIEWFEIKNVYVFNLDGGLYILQVLGILAISYLFISIVQRIELPVRKTLFLILGILIAIFFFFLYPINEIGWLKTTISFIRIQGSYLIPLFILLVKHG